MDIGISKKQAYWILQIAGWSIYAIIYLVLLYIASEESANLTVNILLLSGYFFVSSHALRNYIIRNNWLVISLLKLLPRLLLATFFLAASNYVFYILISYLLKTINPADDFKFFFIAAYIFSSMVIYLLWALIYVIYHYFEKYNTSLKYDAAIYEIELNKLKSQLNPHFIFNALNSIRALVDEDPLKSKRAITQLSNILRNSLIMNKRKLIDLKDEIYTVKDYLELESIRLEERLSVEIDVPPEADSCQVPPLMLQTLVENGIKHGVASLPEGGAISLKAWINKSELNIEIRNSGQYINGAEVDSAGHGLPNTRQRLKLIFGDAATLDIVNENENTVLTHIIIPRIN